MSAKKAEAVYRRPKLGFEDNDPDSWHDLAICDAYDRAVDGTSTKRPSKGAKCGAKPSQTSTTVKSAKRNVTTVNRGAGDNPEQDIVWSRIGTAHEKKKNGQDFEALTSTEQENDDPSWKPGDKCVALFSEDGLYYDCVILSTDKVEGTCFVEYDGYGNRDTVNLEDVYSPEMWNDLQANENANAATGSSKHSSDTSPSSSNYTTTSALSSTEGTSSDVTQNIYAGRMSKKKKSDDKRKGRSRQNRYPPMAPPSFHMGPLMGMPPPPPFITHGFPRDLRPPDAGDLSDDALSSMLMSWYMAGYHTGYYQGISAGNNKKHKRR